MVNTQSVHHGAKDRVRLLGNIPRRSEFTSLGNKVVALSQTITTPPNNKARVITNLERIGRQRPNLISRKTTANLKFELFQIIHKSQSGIEDRPTNASENQKL